MSKIDYCEIVIRYNPRNMPPTSLIFLEREVKEIAEGFIPALNVRTEPIRARS